jgi:hypothetical protein
MTSFERRGIVFLGLWVVFALVYLVALFLVMRAFRCP